MRVERNATFPRIISTNIHVHHFIGLEIKTILISINLTNFGKLYIDIDLVGEFGNINTKQNDQSVETTMSWGLLGTDHMNYMMWSKYPT